MRTSTYRVPQTFYPLRELVAPPLPELPPAPAEAKPRAPDPREKELRTKVEALVKARFGGSLDRAFAHYDENRDGAIDRAELGRLLADAKIGTWLTRRFWVDGVLAKLDANRDGKIQRAELAAATRRVDHSGSLE